MTRLLSSITKKVFTSDNILNLNKVAYKNEYAYKEVTDIIQELSLLKNNDNGLLGYHDEFLFKAFKHNLKHFAFPPSICHVGTGMEREERYKSDNNLWELLGEEVTKIMSFLGSYENALIAYYPNNGYIGWHHNGNASGYNILLSYSIEGKGYFKYYDRESKQVVYMNDKPGWNLKVGYYPDQNKEPNRVYWHAAATEDPRLSIAFVLKDRNIWINMIEDLTGNEFDRDEVLNQGPM